MIKTIAWKDNQVVMIDQRKLPWEEIYVVCSDYRQVIKAIKTMVIRGAPAIGLAAALGAALGAQSIPARDPEEFRRRFREICREIGTRPAHGGQPDPGPWKGCRPRRNRRRPRDSSRSKTG